MECGEWQLEKGILEKLSYLIMNQGADLATLGIASPEPYHEIDVIGPMDIGECMPHFELMDENGQLFNDQSLMGKPSVIYFYPKDETAGCTAQACSFRDGFTAFEILNARVIGISADSSERHARFKEKNRLPFTLLADNENQVRRLFGLKNDVFGLLPGRETFVFDAKGKLIHKFNSQFQVNRHVKEALEALGKAT